MSGLDAALLSALRAEPLHASGTALAEQLNVNLGEVEQAIEGLREAGFEFEDRPGLGYRLVAAPDRLIAADVQSRLGPSDFIREIIVLNKTGSTNDYAAHLGRTGARGGIVVFAEEQTAGRGRFARAWESASHLGLWFSVLLRPELPEAQWERLTTWAAVSIAEAIESATGLRLGIKWPNDLHLRSRKAGGILTETVLDQQRSRFAVVGVGLNVNHTDDDFGAGLAGEAVSLRQALGSPVDRSELAATILKQMERRQVALENAFSDLVEEAARRSVLLGGFVKVRTGSGEIEGVAEALSPDGHLIVRNAAGVTQVVSAGEATLHR